MCRYFILSTSSDKGQAHRVKIKMTSLENIRFTVWQGHPFYVLYKYVSSCFYLVPSHSLFSLRLLTQDTQAFDAVVTTASRFLRCEISSSSSNRFRI